MSAYLPHTELDIAEMLETIGKPSIEELFRGVPKEVRLSRPLALPRALSEQEVLEEMRGRAAENASRGSHDYFLGAGVYPHFTPSAVDALISRTEFYTAYTP